MLTFSPGGGLGFPHLSLDGEGRFTFQSVPAGTYWPVIEGLPPGIAIARVIFNGEDVTGRPIEVRDNVRNTLVLQATSQSGHLVGRILTSADQGTAEYFVVLIPSDRRYWNPTLARGVVVKPDASGEYELTQVPAGRYKIVLTPDISQTDLENLSTLSALADLGVDVEVAPGTTRRQDLKVIR